MISRQSLRGKRWIALPVIITMTVGAAFAFWGSGSVPGGNGATAATAINQGATPTAVATGGSVTLSWAASTMTAGGAVSGYLVQRYDSSTLASQTILTACTGTVAALACTESNVPSGTWVYSVIPVVGTNWRGAESLKSNAVTTDSTAPLNAVTTALVSGAATMVGTTVYYRGGAAGSVKLTNALTDSGSGPASSTTATLGGTTTGWTHSISTVSTPAGGPYQSNVFSWAAGTTSVPTEVVTGRDAAGNVATTTVTFVNDTAGPTGTISYTNGFQPGRTVDVTLTSADAGSGVTTRQIQRKSAPLNGGTCGAYSLFADVGPANPSSPYTDNGVVNGTCYIYQYVLTDALGNTSTITSANVSKVDYSGAVGATAGLLSMWRLGEASVSVLSADSFTGASASPLSTHTGETAASWTKLTAASGGSFEQISSQGRAFRAGAGQDVYYASATPASADYSVEADIYYKGALANDSAGVVARLSSGAFTYYSASWETDDTWKIQKWTGTTVNSVVATTVAQTDLTVGQTYRIRLTVSGSATTTLKLYVNGVLKLTGTDSSSPYTAAGQAGIIDGRSTSGTASDTVGLHLDNFEVFPSTYPRAADSKGSNPADYENGPILGATGVLPGDSNTAVTFDGVSDYVQATGTTGVPVGASARSVEMWFKTTSAAQQVLFAYGSLAAGQEFGLWLNAGGSTMTAWGYGGTNDKNFTLASAVNDGAWHQVVETYDGTNVTLYIDGVAVGSQAVTLATVIDQYGFGIGAVVNPADAVNSGMFFKGTLDEVSLYTTALSAATVTNHFQFSDGAGPSGGSVAATGLVGTGSVYSTSTTLNLTLAKGTDPSGLAATGNQLLRATATLTSTSGGNGVCGTFGAYTLVTGGTDPASPKTDVVADQACYSYRYVVSDAVGNATTYTSGNVKVDTTGPTAPTFTFSNISGTYWPGSGSVVYYSGGASGAFTATATATDAVSGIASYAFPSLGLNWVSTPGALGVNTYSWSSPPAVPGTKSVTATNNATVTGAGGSFTATLDNTAPTTGTITYPNATQTATTVSVSFTTGTDGGSGMGTRLLQRAAASLTAGVCGSYNPFVTVAGGTNPSSPFVDTVTRGACYKYQYVTSDNVGNQGAGATSTNVVKVLATYYDTVFATAGLVNYWRLGEGATTSDSFTGTAGTTLQTHPGEIGATWTKASVSNSDVVFTAAGRIRKSLAASSFSDYYTSATPVTADYTVEADVYVASNLAGDVAGITARLNTAAPSGTFYSALYDQALGQWVLYSVVNGTKTVLGTSTAALTVGSTYRLSLVVTGTSIRLLVKGVQLVSVVNSAISAAGRAGVVFGNGTTTTTDTDSAGMHLDNFLATPRLLDDKAANPGDYFGTQLGVAGAILNDSDKAATFDGVSDFGSVTETVTNDFSVEFWFKSTQGIGVGGTTWQSGAGLVDANITGSNKDWGISLSADGHIIAGDGNGTVDFSVVSTTGGYDDGTWHQVVVTRSVTTGLIQIYVDGVADGSVTGSTLALTAPTINFGRLASPGNYYAGSLDEIALYNAVLSQATITAHFLANQ